MANPSPKAGPGRPKGSQNKLTREIKEAIVNAFEKVGSEDYLVRVAQEDPRTFCSLLGRALPLQVTGDAENPVEHKLTIAWKS